MPGLLPSPLYLIADRATCAPRPLEAVLARALDAGVRLLQLREKAIEDESLRRLAESVQALAAARGAVLLINGRADLAVAVGAGGVHLPASGPSPAAVRAAFGPDLLIGCSAHTLDELDRAEAEGADFVTYSPVYPPVSKPGYGPGVGLSGLRAAVARAALPVYALGGIVPERVPGCRTAGAAGIAAMSGILAAEDVESTVRSYLLAWEREIS